MRRITLIAIAIGCLLLHLGPDTHAQGVVDPVFTGSEIPNVQWQARYDGPISGIDRVTSVALHPDGTIVYVAGESYGTTYSMDFVTVAYDAVAGGNPLWVARYDTLWRGNDGVTQIQVSPDGNLLFVTGTSIGSGADGGVGMGLGAADWDFMTIAYDARNGVPLWERRFHGHQRADGWTDAIAVSPDSGTVLINGRSDCSDDPFTAEIEPGNATIAYDALTGDELWVSCFADALARGEFGAKLAISGDGAAGIAVVTGTHRNGANGLDIATLALSMQTGERLWLRHYDNGLHHPGAFPTEPVFIGSDPTYDSARDIAVDPSGNVVYVTGESRGAYGLVDYVTIAYELSTGDQKGVARFDGALHGHDRAFAIAVDSSVCVCHVPPGNPANAHTIRVGESAVAAHLRHGDMPGACPLGVGREEQATCEGGRVFVTGESQTSDSGREVVTVAYDGSLGVPLWTARYNTSDAPDGVPDSRDDIGRMIEVDAEGDTVVVGGDSWGSNSLDWIVLAYDAATGERRWAGQYDGVLSHADFIRGLALAPDAGWLYAAGHSCSCGTSGMDILTMAIRIPQVSAVRSEWPLSNPFRPARRVRGMVERY